MDLRIGSTVVSVRDVPRAVEFWTAALGYVVRDGQIDEDFTVLAPPDGGWSNLSVQRSESPPSRPNRLHLDLYAEDQDAEVERLLALGAARPPWDYPADADFVVLTDPDGNEFCVIAKGASASAPAE
jgi:catechol 2,3-dioxygenase-like lactoylglutathione lyase family enzyme